MLHACVCTGALAHRRCMWMSEVDSQVYFSVLHLISEPGLCLPFSTAPPLAALGLQGHDTTSQIFVSTRDSNSGLHSFVANTLPNESYPTQI